MRNPFERFGNVSPVVWKTALLVGAVLIQAIVLLQVNRAWREHSRGSPAEQRTELPKNLPPLEFVEGASKPTPQETATPDAASTPRLSLTRELHTSDLDGILKRRHIRVLIVFNRTNYFLARGVQMGFEYSLLRDYEKVLNEGKGKRDQKVHMEFIPVYRDQLIPKLLAGEGDIAAAGLTITPERLKEVDFTDPYLEGVDEVVVSRKGVKAPQSVEELSRKEIHVRESSSYHESLMELNRAFKEKGLKPAKARKVSEVLETEDILELVSAGTWDMTVADSHLARIWSGVYDNLAVHEGLKLREGGKIAWMVRKENVKLKEGLNRFIRGRRKGTKLGNIYFNRYYKNDKWVARTFEEEERRRLEEYRPLFEKYSKMYGIPWLFTAAVAYQESGFDQSKKSGAGAVGIMQVLPSTAADKNVGISDISTVENNIHAGVKYLAFLRDRYFAEGDYDQQSQIHFVLASYNAGPGNIRRARREAPSWGVDPDRWFKNVENVTLRTVSQEPVQYVVNINRYFFIFEQYLEQARVRAEEKRNARN
jgi:membrane-bound lytic murein transglycosylase MltF